MASPPPPPSAQYDTVAVIGPQYCMPSSVEFVMTQNPFSRTHYTIADINGGLVFKIKGKIISIGDKSVLVDNADNPIITMQRKVTSVRGRWQVFRGDSSEEKDLLFCIKRTSIIQIKRKLEVFLATNTDEKHCDFKMDVSFFRMSGNIYLGDSKNVVAQIHQKFDIKNTLRGKGTFAVTIFPNVDSAFIVVLMAALVTL